ncbi:MAG: TolC family protein [Cellulophaga sp.]|nr:TolC family protein [Cellulophaga sp.]
MNFKIVVIFSFFVMLKGYSQEIPKTFTLEEAIAFALKNNYNAINADRDIIDAQKQKWETIAAGLPQITGAVSYQNQLKQPVSLLPGEIAGGEPGTFVPLILSVPQTLSATATLSQQIFDGSYIVGVQAAKTFISYSANNKEKTAIEVKKSVVEAYGNVLLAQESVEILNKNIATLEKNLFETKKIFENGLGDEESVEQLQITLSSVQNQLKNAIRLKEITVQMLNLTLGIMTDSPTTLAESLDDLTLKQTDLSLMEADFNINNNVDYKLAQNLNEQRFFELKLAKSRALPTLNAFVNYGSTSFNDQFNFLQNDAQWFDASVFGVDLSIPIFSSFKRSASTQRAKIALDKAKTQLTEAEEQIRLQLKQSRSNYILAIEQYRTNKENLALAERIENKNQIKYAEGIASSFELRQAQLQLYDAQNQHLQSMVDVINTKTSLEAVLNE